MPLNFVDYREALGIGFNDVNKYKFFKTRMINFLDGLGGDCPPLFSIKEYFHFCVQVGLDFKENPYESEYYHKVLSVLKDCYDIETFLAYYIFFLMCFEDVKDKQTTKEELTRLLKNSLVLSRIPYEIFDDEGNMFIFPKGAKELDDALISKPLEWLKDYPKAHSTFSRALRQYANGEHTRDVADNFRKALEEFFREFLHNEIDLENNRSLICSYLKEKGSDANLTNMLQPLIDGYKKINDAQVKHKDTFDPKFLEFIMYQTGLFIRMIITVEKEGENE